jgi:glutamate carboxypeptidase
MRQLLAYCDDHASQTIQTLETLVRLESPSTDKPAVDRCGAALAEILRDAGAEVELLRQAERGDHIRARFRGDGAPVLLLGHFDTVWPIGTLQRMPLRRHGDRLHGPGTFDMKAGIAIGIAAAIALRATPTPHPPITMLWTADEEVGSSTSRAVIEAEARQSRAVLVLEPALPGGALKTARKGCGEYEVIVHGVAAHAGLDPGKGASAIHELASLIASIERLQDLERGITVNAGVISGGTRPNVVAEEARATIDVRAKTTQRPWTHNCGGCSRSARARVLHYREASSGRRSSGRMRSRRSSCGLRPSRKRSGATCAKAARGAAPTGTSRRRSASQH